MRKAIVLASAALVLCAAVPADALARHTLAHRVRALETKVTALQTKVNALHRFTHNCLAWDWAPIAWYGNEQAGFGYVFDNDGAGPAMPFYTTALDIAAVSTDTLFHVAVVNGGCLNQVAPPGSALRAELRGAGSGRGFG
jgi:hypothetical protein